MQNFSLFFSRLTARSLLLLLLVFPLFYDYHKYYSYEKLKSVYDALSRVHIIYEAAGVGRSKLMLKFIINFENISSYFLRNLKSFRLDNIMFKF